MHKRRKFTKMYEEYADDIFRFLYVHVQDEALAEDLTADTFTKAFQKIEDFDFKQSRAWLYTIARNTMTDYWRKKRPIALDEKLEIADDRPSHEEVFDKQLVSEELLAAIKRLPEDMKLVVSLRFMQGLSVRDTAFATGLTETNVRVIQYRALKKMRGLLTK